MSARAAAAATIVVLVLTGCTNSSTTNPRDVELDKYTSRCTQTGGILSREEGWQSTYRCIGQTTGVPLPEFKR